MAKLRLFCFPYAGGGASGFYAWANELPSDVEIIGIQMANLKSRFKESPTKSVKSVVEMLAYAIYPKLNKPFSFFGHSLGALIGFELARKLSKQYGFRPIHLFVSGMRAPQITDSRAPIHSLKESEFLVELHRRYEGLPDEFLQCPDIMKDLLPGLRADFKMYESYTYIDDNPLDCHITAFGGLQDYSVSRKDLEAWRNQTMRAFALYMVPGNHFFIYYERKYFLRLLSNEIIKTLERLR